MNEKILLVEDNEGIILGLTYLFKEEKFNLEIAKTRGRSPKEVYTY